MGCPLSTRVTTPSIVTLPSWACGTAAAGRSRTRTAAMVASIFIRHSAPLRRVHRFPSLSCERKRHEDTDRIQAEHHREKGQHWPDIAGGRQDCRQDSKDQKGVTKVPNQEPSVDDADAAEDEDDR